MGNMKLTLVWDIPPFWRMDDFMGLSYDGNEVELTKYGDVTRKQIVYYTDHDYTCTSPTFCVPRSETSGIHTIDNSY